MKEYMRRVEDYCEEHGHTVCDVCEKKGKYDEKCFNCNNRPLTVNAFRPNALLVEMLPEIFGSDVDACGASPDEKKL